MTTPSRVTTTARVEPEMLERVHERARLEDRSVAAVIRRALTQYLEDGDPANGADNGNDRGEGS